MLDKKNEQLKELKKRLSRLNTTIINNIMLKS